MNTFEKKHLTEIVLYILNKTHGLDYYHVFKVIYFANLSMLTKWGMKMVEDTFCALPDGPVPSSLYDCIKKDYRRDKELSDMLDASITYGTDDSYYILTAKREADTEYLSKAEMEELDKSIRENAYMPYGKLREKSHGAEWQRAYNSSGRKEMNVLGMVKDVNDDKELLSYIEENLDFDKILA